MLKVRVIFFAFLISFAHAWAADEFAGIQCGADIHKVLVGKHVSNGPAAVTENRHRDLGLKNLGGDEISDRLFLAAWQICGGEYELLVNTKQDLIRDVLPFPPHSAAAPMFIGTCQVGGKDISGIVVAVLNNSAGHDARDKAAAKTMLAATAAWKIDETKGKFYPQSTVNLGCPLGGINTGDGGP